MIEEALRCTLAKWPEPPRVPTWIVIARHRHWTEIVRDECALVTFVDEDKTRRKRDPGRCYRRAGFEEAGRTKAGLLALVIRTARLPSARAAGTMQTALPF